MLRYIISIYSVCGISGPMQVRANKATFSLKSIKGSSTELLKPVPRNPCTAGFERALVEVFHKYLGGSVVSLDQNVFVLCSARCRFVFSRLLMIDS